MTARAGLVAAVVLYLGVTARAAGPGPFTFSTPSGWIEISRGAPEAQRQKAPPSLLALSNNPDMAFVAYDPASGGDGFTENVNAIVRMGKNPPPITPALLVELQKGMAQQVAPQGLAVRPVSSDLVKIGGVTAGHLVSELKGPNGTFLTIQYMIPGEMSFATLTLTTTPGQRGRYEATFDAAALATVGAVEPPSASDRASYQVGKIVGAVVGAVAALAIVNWLRKRKSAPPTKTPA